MDLMEFAKLAILAYFLKCNFRVTQPLARPHKERVLLVWNFPLIFDSTVYRLYVNNIHVRQRHQSIAIAINTSFSYDMNIHTFWANHQTWRMTQNYSDLRSYTKKSALIWKCQDVRWRCTLEAHWFVLLNSPFFRKLSIFLHTLTIQWSNVEENPNVLHTMICKWVNYLQFNFRYLKFRYQN